MGLEKPPDSIAWSFNSRGVLLVAPAWTPRPILHRGDEVSSSWAVAVRWALEEEEEALDEEDFDGVGRGIVRGVNTSGAPPDRGMDGVDGAPDPRFPPPSGLAPPPCGSVEDTDARRAALDAVGRMRREVDLAALVDLRRDALDDGGVVVAFALAFVALAFAFAADRGVVNRPLLRTRDPCCCCCCLIASGRTNRPHRGLHWK